MTWNKGKISVTRADRLPEALPEPAAPLTFKPDGRFGDSTTAKIVGAKGGKAKAQKRKLLMGLELSKLVETDDFYPYWQMMLKFIEEKLLDLASQCGGYIGPGPTSLIVTAGKQYAASGYMFDLAMKIGGPASTRLFQDASGRGNDSRQNLIAAFELGRREADCRKNDVDPFTALTLAASSDD